MRHEEKCSLNEGRGLDPGNTWINVRWSNELTGAQRRPGPRPRQHLRCGAPAAGASSAQRRPGPRPRQHIGAGWEWPAKTLAQRRPGPRPRQHAVSRHVRRRPGGRSTKAGASTPATLPVRTLFIRSSQRAQRRPGPRPRQHNHPHRVARKVAERSTKAGASTPATPPTSTTPSGGPATLNEGRGLDPGNTWCVWSRARMSLTAQRRPGPRPRQHTSECTLFRVWLVAQRRPGPRPRQHASAASLSAAPKAAQRRPGPRPRQHASPSASTWAGAGAQRRPGPRPRQHVRLMLLLVDDLLRSTKAGASTPATPAHRPLRRYVPRPLNEGRGLDPGNTTGVSGTNPASRGAQRRPGPRPRQHARCSWCPTKTAPALNEGRGLDPGNTPRAVPTATTSTPLNEGRGLDPGNTVGAVGPVAVGCHAQRRPGPRPRQHVPPRPGDQCHRRRSTKAGASTPATRADTSTAGDSRSSLNEGRGLDPGNTWAFMCSSHLARDAQRRPGPRPRQHRRWQFAAGGQLDAQRRPGPRPRQHFKPVLFPMSFGPAQRRPGPRPRQHLVQAIPTSIGSPRSTKAGASTPATPLMRRKLAVQTDKIPISANFMPRPPDTGVLIGANPAVAGTNHAPAPGSPKVRKPVRRPKDLPNGGCPASRTPASSRRSPRQTDRRSPSPGLRQWHLEPRRSSERMKLERPCTRTRRTGRVVRTSHTLGLFSAVVQLPHPPCLRYRMTPICPRSHASTNGG